MPDLYITGGAVRDLLLGNKPKDLDYLWVGATPSHMSDQGMTLVGEDFPVYLDKDGNEHALARKERKTGTGYTGFECEYDTSVTLEDDLIRRDLTINSMCVKKEDWDEFVKTKNAELVIDPFNGLDDLKKGILRHTSSAFSEDPVRVLRVARFKARYKFAIADDTLSLMKKLVKDGELDNLVPERVKLELEKSLMEEYPFEFFRSLEHCNAFGVLFKEFGASSSSPKFKYLTKAALRNKDLTHRIIMLCDYLSAEDSIKFLVRLKFSNDIILLMKKFNVVLELFGDHERLYTPGSILGVLKEINAFKSPDSLYMISSFLTFYEGQCTARMDIILQILQRIKYISFSSLLKDQQRELKGKEIGEAIDALREDEIKEFFKYNEMP